MLQCSPTPLPRACSQPWRDAQDRLAVWHDYFCGGGLAAFGAAAAGFTVARGIDQSGDALDVFKLNFPDARAVRATLPTAGEPPPDDGGHHHFHFSPPCTDVSTAKAKAPCAAARGGDALKLLHWSVGEALARACGAGTGVGVRTWSVETVVCKPAPAPAPQARSSASPTLQRSSFNASAPRATAHGALAFAVETSVHGGEK